MNIYKVLIVGGGASGLLCATELLSGDEPFCGADVIILERNDRVGKKLIATGNGQGNLFNAAYSEKNYSSSAELISEYLSFLGKLDIREYFRRLGVITAEREEGKIYPVSRQANSVLDVLRSFLENKKCNVAVSERVTSVEKKGGYFAVCTQSGKVYNAYNVVFAFGGKAGTSFGTDGSAYSLAEKTGHTVTPLYPSLVQLKTDTSFIKGLKGIKEDVVLKAIYNGKTLKTCEGELLFTDYGVSGNAVFKISDKVTDKQGVILSVEFLPKISFEELKSILTDRIKLGFYKQEDLLSGLLAKRLGQYYIRKYGVKNLDILCRAVKGLRLSVTGNTGFSNAQVTKGGINVEEIDVKTFRSKKTDGLYIIGEALDLDGECGGYNLTFAFTSGIACAMAIKGVL